MKRWYIGLAVALCAGAFAFAACGGGGDDGGDKAATGTQTNKTKTVTAGKTGTPGASGTTTAGTPGSNATAGSNTTTAAGGSPGPGSTLAPGETPQPGVTPAANPSTPIALEASTPTTFERDVVGDVVDAADRDLIGGDVDAPPEVITDLPDRPPGASTDPSTIGAPNVTTDGMEAIVDLSASEDGIQATRTIKVGDIIRVGLILTNVPDTGMAGFQFRLNYDKTKIVAPTIINGSSLSRNPDANEAGLGSGGGGWSCLNPAPQGDADDPGGLPGDGDPATGEAIMECLGPPPLAYEVGVIVFATVQFQAIAPGSVDIGFNGTDYRLSSEFSAFVNQNGTSLGSCGGIDPPIPCRRATLTVE